MQSPTKARRGAGGKPGSEDELETTKPIEPEDFGDKHLRPSKKADRGQETTRSAIRALNQPSLLRERAVASIQQHVDRIQTGSSLETVNRNQGALAALTQSQLLMKGQLTKQKTQSDMTAGALNAYGSLSKSPMISNMKTHTGYQFSKSGLNARSTVPMKVIGN